MNIENVLETKRRELESKNYTSGEYVDLYKDIENERLRILFSYLHGGFIDLFRTLNERLPTGDFEAHFWADPSRDLIFIIETTFSLQGALKQTELSFIIDDYYDAIIKNCREFLSKSGGSTIPAHMEKINLYYLEPIFSLNNSINIKTNNRSTFANLKLIGSGSYAHVFKFRDDFYGKSFVLKRAKSDLNEKEIVRFKREYEQMKTLNSPYIVEVHSYNDERNEYIMELMDFTLEKYIELNNAKLTAKMRKSIVLQLLRAYGYLHSKKIFHRDISVKNVLLKQYDDVLVVKISDFGLVKIVDSDLTSENTEFKGSLNDPSLKVEGFEKYELTHELYAITLLFAYIITGKSNWSKITDPQVKAFIAKGTNADKSKRFQTLKELGEEALKCCNILE